jgi:hypothetical protein
MTLRLLVMAPRSSKAAPPAGEPKSVTRMRANAATSVKQVFDGLQPLDDAFSASGKQFVVEVRSYKELPTVHGFSLSRGGGKPMATYLSFCRWKADGSDLEWGAMSYRRVLHEGEDPAGRDLLAIFTGAFEHLWRTGGPVGTIALGKRRPRSGRS